MANRTPGRPRKHVGLVPVLKKVSDGPELRDLRDQEYKPEGSVLQEAPENSAPPARTSRIFGAAEGDDGGRRADAIPPAVLDSPGRTGTDDADVTFTNLLKKIGLEIAAPLHQDRDTQMLNLEVLARKVWREALSLNMGSQKAREMIAERLEGKAVRGDKPVQPDTTIEEQIDRAEVDLINSLKKDA
jgi:hypothetical protein